MSSAKSAWIMPKTDPNCFDYSFCDGDWWRWMLHNSSLLFARNSNAMRGMNRQFLSVIPNRSSIFKWAEWKWEICEICNLFWIGNRSSDVFVASGRRQFLIEFRRTVEMRLISIIWRQCTQFSMIDGPKMCVCVCVSKRKSTDRTSSHHRRTLAK